MGAPPWTPAILDDDKDTENKFNYDMYQRVGYSLDGWLNTRKEIWRKTSGDL